MLELGRQRPVLSDDRPAVLEDFPFGSADVDHRLDGEDHAGPQADATPGRAQMGDAGRLVQAAAHAVPAPLAHHAIAVRFRVGLDGGADIADARAGLGADATLESALEPIAAQVEGTVEPLSTATNDGMQVQFSDEASGLTQRQVLFPYGDMGEVFYIQTLAPTDQEDVIDSILDSLELAPPQPDVDALDAAWTGPEHLPRPGEIADARAWLRRVA